MSQNDQSHSQKINGIINEQSTLLTEASKVMSTVLTNLYGFLDELSKFGNEAAVSNEQKKKEFEETLDMTRKITQYIDQVHLEIPALVESLNDSDNQLKNCQQQLETSNKLLEEIKRKQDEMTKESNVQANYTAAIGSTMGAMLWKTSKTEEIIQTFIDTGTIQEFIIMSNITLNSFTDSFKENLPDCGSYEYKFILSVIGTSINISAQVCGRNYLLGQKVGMTFINGILEYIDRIKMPEGRLLKRMCLIFLYNMSICKRGAIFIQTSQNGIANILKCFAPCNTSEIQSLSISLMISLMNEIWTQEFGQQVMKLASIENLKLLMEHDDENVNHLSRQFHDKLLDLKAAVV